MMRWILRAAILPIIVVTVVLLTLSYWMAKGTYGLVVLVNGDKSNTSFREFLEGL